MGRFEIDFDGHFKCECGDCNRYYPINKMDIFNDKLMYFGCIEDIKNYMYMDEMENQRFKWGEEWGTEYED